MKKKKERNWAAKSWDYKLPRQERQEHKWEVLKPEKFLLPGTQYDSTFAKEENLVECTVSHASGLITRYSPSSDFWLHLLPNMYLEARIRICRTFSIIPAHVQSGEKSESLQVRTSQVRSDKAKLWLLVSALTLDYLFSCEGFLLVLVFTVAPSKVFPRARGCHVPFGKNRWRKYVH